MQCSKDISQLKCPYIWKLYVPRLLWQTWSGVFHQCGRSLPYFSIILLYSHFSVTVPTFSSLLAKGLGAEPLELMVQGIILRVWKLQNFLQFRTFR